MLLLVLVVACLLAVPAAAQTDADRAAAQALFDEAQQLKEEGNLKAACTKFEKSMDLDPAVGTQLNLADCYERQGRTASAWVNYSEASQLDQADSRRAQFARDRAEALKPKLTRMRLEVAGRAPGMTITRDGQPIPEATWGTSVPVDPGSYELLAKAPGKLPWREDVEIAGEGEVVTVEVPALADAGDDEVVAPPPVPDAPDDDDSGNGQLIAGAVVGSVGVVGIGIGAVLAGMAHSKAAESEDHCRPDEPNMCTQPGVDLREDAQGLQTIYAVSFAVGGAAAIAGLVMILTSPSGEAADSALPFAPLVGPEIGGLTVGGRF